jgi:serine/threonine protein kinase
MGCARARQTAIRHPQTFSDTVVTDAVLEQLQSELAERYAVTHAAGHGAMASVYVARDIRHDRLVAIKALRVSTSHSASERFNREIRYLAHLQHPHILPLFDSGSARGILFFVTAYVHGNTLRGKLEIAPAGQLPIKRVLQWSGEIASALDHAHQRDILHRDIKPENILLSDDSVLVADFGIARVIRDVGGEGVLTSPGVAIGSPAYMSPEQLAADRQLDARSDVYSLACVVYEMFAGVLPFSNARGVVNNAHKFIGVPAPLADKRADLPARLDHILARALTCDPAVRFASASEFVSAITDASDR